MSDPTITLPPGGKWIRLLNLKPDDNVGTDPIGTFIRRLDVNQGPNVVQLVVFPQRNWGDSSMALSEKETGESRISSIADLDPNTLWSSIPTEEDKRVIWDTVEFSLDVGWILSLTPKQVANQAIENDSDFTTQTTRIYFTEEVVKTLDLLQKHRSTFEMLHSKPLTAEDIIKHEATTTHDFAWALTQPTNEDILTFNKAYSDMTEQYAAVIMIGSKHDNPTIYTTPILSKIEIVTHDVHNGVHVWNLKAKYQAYPLDPSSGNEELPPPIIVPLRFSIK